MKKKALIVSGGWDGHRPQECAEIIIKSLEARNILVTPTETLESFDKPAELLEYDVIIPNWTMGKLTADQEKNLMAAIRSGVGLAGWHGGMGDAFRENSAYQFMTGGQFVSHPGNIKPYQVHFQVQDHFITRGLSDFEITTEQYFMHVDPSIHVLANTVFKGSPEGMDWVNEVKMPVLWTKTYGKGKVFYSSIGHQPDTLSHPTVLEFTTRGVEWALK
ncbi:MAG: ThuA domain-containing protein [Verrucomicrobiota bacterium]